MEEHARLKLKELKIKYYFNKFCGNKSGVLDILGVKEGELLVKYLGVSISSNKIKDREGVELVSKIRDKLQGWSS